MIFPDYTLHVQQQRRSFLAVKQEMRAMQILYMLLFPAKLKVLHVGVAHFFVTPQEGWTWLEKSLQKNSGEPSQNGSLINSGRDKRWREWRTPRKRGRKTTRDKRGKTQLGTPQQDNHGESTDSARENTVRISKTRRGYYCTVKKRLLLMYKGRQSPKRNIP